MTYTTTPNVLFPFSNSLYKRMLPTAFSGTLRRFIETMDFFFQSVTQQAIDRTAGRIPDLESYIILRRDTSGCKPCWALVECKVLFHTQPIPRLGLV